MTTFGRIDVQSTITWMSMEGVDVTPGAEERCTVESVQQGVSHLPGVEVVSVTVNTTGQQTAPPGITEVDLPDFCDVRLQQELGGHVVTTTVWVPLAWNGRLLGVVGQGMRASAPWVFGDMVRVASLPKGVRNGFVTVESDAGQTDPRIADWGFDTETRELDWDLIRNWVHRSAHEMTIVAKAVTAAIHGREPAYSYLQGSSGGGRQAMAEAQKHPTDYDGIWAADPGMHVSSFLVSALWPPVVMNELDNPLHPDKLDAFRLGYLEACGGEIARDGYITDIEYPQWDPAELVGAQTPQGPITELDATVMRLIWEGPTDAEGRPLWYPLRPDAESWGRNVHHVGHVSTIDIDGTLTPDPFFVSLGYVGSWVLKDPNWDWRTLTRADFEQLFERSRTEFAEIDTDDPDLSGLRDAGAKLLLNHGQNDEVIPAAGSTRYYERVLEQMGGFDEVSSFARYFLSPGDGHCHVTAAGPGISLATGMAALMEWVENDHAPETIIAERRDPTTTALLSTRAEHPYGCASR